MKRSRTGKKSISKSAVIKRQRRTDICASRRVNRDTVGLIHSHTALPTRVESTQTAALCFVRADVSGANDAGRRNSRRVSLCLSLPFLLSIEKKRFSRIPRGGQWASFLAWKRGESGAHAYESAVRRYNIILYTREKRKRREKGEKKKRKEIEDSVEKLNNQAVCSREGRFITINTFALMEDARPNINLNLVSKAKRKKKKKEKCLFIASRIFMFSRPRAGEWGSIDGSAI